MVHEFDDRSWTLAVTGGPSKAPREFHPLAEEWHNIEQREKSVGIPSGQPILTSPRLVDYRLGDYFREAFPSDRGSTAVTYARELRTWFRFLERLDVSWDDASPRDVRAFQIWRVYDERNPSRITAATWNKGWAALRHFYRWAERQEWGADSPIGDQARLRSTTDVGGHREKNARNSRDRWITPPEFSMWRNVGLRGYGTHRDDRGRVVAGLPDNGARARNMGRNAAFVDFLITTGLRLNEATTVLEFELPTDVADEVPIVGKGGVRRHYRLMSPIGSRALSEYRLGERRDVIRRAQAVGRYGRIGESLLVHEVLDDRTGQRLRLADGRLLKVDGVSLLDRTRLFIQGADGPEPAWFWLTDTGTPMTAPGWEKVFDAANSRVTRARRQHGMSSPWVNVTPHSLRFTFALLVLIAGIRAIDEHLGIKLSDPFVVRNYSQVFDEIRDRLGHGSVETTKRIYLEPAKALRRTTLLRGQSMDEIWESLVTASPLIGLGGY